MCQQRAVSVGYLAFNLLDDDLKAQSQSDTRETIRKHTNDERRYANIRKQFASNIRRVFGRFSPCFLLLEALNHHLVRDIL